MRAATYNPGHNTVRSHSIEQYRGTPYTVSKMVQLARGSQGERSPRIRRHAEQIIGNVRPKDYASEIIAVYHWWVRANRYTRDPLHVEMIKSPERLLDDAEKGRLTVDCDEVGLAIATDCLVLGAPAQFVTVGFRPDGQHTHVFTRARDPRSGVWWVLDPIPGRRVGQMLRRVKAFRVYDI